MRFGVLVSLQVTAGDSEEPGLISAPRLRALLTVLASHAAHASHTSGQDQICVCLLRRAHDVKDKHIL